ncbi:hypothetical protein C1E24_05540 [Pseudoalteromonas phenolica]|uniref:Uncharacterized protein n=1 Tax=Pseudoalteromonas phenolica TaxID=161398 RepID=A0A5R9Q531_9GAMM|nr:hypothetical protein [Pseudoalteromonas phenolica]TLX48261.1 hypothetical protein C1E24_05540 [Pseudoalteromonas phenolica]
MEELNNNLDNTVIDSLKNKDHSGINKQLDQLSCSHSDIIELLAEYVVLAEQDDESFDAWYDGLCEDKLKVLKAFEIMRAHLES